MYDIKESMMFSIIYSQLEGERYKTPTIPHDILFFLFNYSQKKNINIYRINIEERGKFLQEVFKIFSEKYPRKKIDKRKESLERLFLDEGRIGELFTIVDKEIKICNENNIKIIPFNSNKYPEKLKKLEDPPFTIFIKGKLPSDKELEKSLAIIGSRKIEPNYSEKVAKKVAETLFDNGWWNISGLARGIDTYGHVGSLNRGGLTGAILGYGLNQKIYPAENEKLAHEILRKDGFLMSEIPPSTKKEDIFLTQRNRLQSGLTNGIFVVATSTRGGTLHTIKYSVNQNDKVTFIWHPSSVEEYHQIDELKGNHSLIEIRDKTLFPTAKFTREEFKKIHPIKNAKELNEILKTHKKVENHKHIQKTIF